MSDQPIDEAHDPPSTDVVNRAAVRSDEGTHGDSTDSNTSTPPVQAGIEELMLDVIKQLRVLNANVLKPNNKIDRLQYLMIEGIVSIKINKKNILFILSNR
jgi:hypothetical protein